MEASTAAAVGYSPPRLRPPRFAVADDLAGVFPTASFFAFEAVAAFGLAFGFSLLCAGAETFGLALEESLDSLPSLLSLPPLLFGAG